MNQQLEMGFKPMTLLEARTDMMTEARSGLDTECPCCGRYVKLYKRKLHAEMVIWLIGLDKLCRGDGGYHSTVEILDKSPHLKAGGTNGTLLVHWGLIKKIPNENRAGAPANQYTITQKGRNFLHRGITVPERVHILCGEVVGFDEHHTDIDRAVGSKFDYKQLMYS